MCYFKLDKEMFELDCFNCKLMYILSTHACNELWFMCYFNEVQEGFSLNVVNYHNLFPSIQVLLTKIDRKTKIC